MPAQSPPPGSWRRRLCGALRDTLAFLLPQRCLACACAVGPARALCGTCSRTLARLDVAVCAHCLAEERIPVGCSSHPQAQVVAPWLYDERVAGLVHALKFGGRPGLARGLAPVMASALPRSWRRPDLVCPVPLHPVRRRERGYDQAERLAAALAEWVGAPLVPDVLVRIRATPPQTGLGAGARRANLSGAFELRRTQWVRDRRVLLVDDVLTTGSTFQAALATLARARAQPLGVAIAWAQ